MQNTASHRPKRTLRGAFAVTAVITTLGVTSGPASAQPDAPADSSEAQQQLRDVSRRAEELTEKYKKVEDDHAAKKAELDKSKGEAKQAEKVAKQAHAEEERFRGQVDNLTQASYQGARLNKLSALLVSESPNDFLDRATTLDALAKDNNDVIKRLSSATHQAESSERQARQARDRAAKAEAAAARLEGKIAQKKSAMDEQVAKVQEQYNSLSEQEQESLSSGGSDVSSIQGSGSAIDAVNAALSQQGKPYVFGAKGPDEFDCSGLVQYAFEQAGIELPSSTQSQISAGEEVSESEMKPGDVIFFYSSGSHNGIYMGNGQMVHAPTEGQDVTVEQVEYMGEINSVRRFAG